MRLEELERQLRAERPEIDQEFARQLDDWAAAGFPRDGELDRRVGGRAGRGFLGAAGARLRSGWERVTAVPPRRLLAPVGAAATLVVVGAVVIGQGGGADKLSSEIGSSDSGAEMAAPAEDEVVTPLNADGGGATSSEAAEAAPPAPSASDSANAVPDSGAPGECRYCLSMPNDGNGNISRGQEDRLQDATARMRLGAPEGEVQEVANDVVSTTDRYGGVVINSEVTSDQGGARAAFELEIPFAKLDAALTELSELGDVISRTEAAEDITNKAVQAQRDYANVREQIADKRIELIEADTREERLILKSQIASLEAQADTFEAQFNGVQREARFATVNVDVTSDGPDSDEEGGWGIGDAIDDAGSVLETIGGIALVSLAVLLPLALVGALAYWLVTLARKAGREKALDSA